MSIPPITNPSEDQVALPKLLPILPIDNAVLFPAMLLPLAISGDMWVKLVDDTALGDKLIGVFWRRQPGDSFDPLALAKTGTGAQIVRMLRLLDGGVQLLLQGQARIQIEQLLATEPYPMARIRALQAPEEPSLEVEGLARSALTAFQQIVQLNPSFPDELAVVATNMPTPGRLADLIGANLHLTPEDQQAVLDTLDPAARLRLVLGYIEREREILAIGERAREEMGRNQREYVLRQQLEQIRRELGETDERGAEIAELRARLEAANLPEEAGHEAEREIERLERMPPGAAEYVVTRTYLDWLLDLPWNISTPDNLDLKLARTVLDQDHYDLEQVKDRIIEYLAVRKLHAEQGDAQARGPILCFVGPVSARPAWANRSRGRWAVNLCAWRWAACAMRPISAASGAATSARCRGVSSRVSTGPAVTIPCLCSMRWTSSPPDCRAIRRRRCWNCSILSRIASLSTAIWTCPSI